MASQSPLRLPALLLLLIASHVHGGEFEAADFALRFSAALSRLSTYPDVGAQGGASVASLRATSINPAALVWRPIYKDVDERKKAEEIQFYHGAASAQYNGISFDRGTDMWAATQSLTFQPSLDWALKFSASQLRSNEAQIRQGSLFEFDANVFRLDVARRFDHRKHPSSIGMQLSYFQSETNAQLPAGNYPVLTPRGVAVLPFRKQALQDADRQAFTARFGWQIALVGPDAGKDADPTRQFDVLLAGATADFSYQPTKLGTYRPTPAGIPGNPGIHDRQDFYQAFVRAGMAWRYTGKGWAEKGKAGYLRFDYQWGWLHSEYETLQVNRFHFGANLPLFRFLHLYAGAIADERRNVGWSTGLTLILGENVAIEAAYQRDFLPEISYDFGNSKIFLVSAGVAF